jgi:hypothetical protein
MLLEKRYGMIPSGKLTWLWKITMFNGKIHYKWPFSIAMLNYQRVSPMCGCFFLVVSEGFAPPVLLPRPPGALGVQRKPRWPPRPRRGATGATSFLVTSAMTGKTAKNGLWWFMNVLYVDIPIENFYIWSHWQQQVSDGFRATKNGGSKNNTKNNGAECSLTGTKYVAE